MDLFVAIVGLGVGYMIGRWHGYKIGEREFSNWLKDYEARR